MSQMFWIALLAVAVLVCVVLAVRLSHRTFSARVADALTGRLAQAIVTATATAMERNQDELAAIIVAQIRKDPAVRRWRHVPFHDTVVRLIADTSLRILVQTMTDPATEDFVAKVLRDNIDQVLVRSNGSGATPAKAITLRPVNRI